jgi:DNA-binding IscR family transcriptional regulator
VTCLEEEVNLCDKATYCKTLSMWTGLQKTINDYLDSVTLQDMVEECQESIDNWVI